MAADRCEGELSVSIACVCAYDECGGNGNGNDVKRLAAWLLLLLDGDEDCDDHCDREAYVNAFVMVGRMQASWVDIRADVNERLTNRTTVVVVCWSCI